MEYKDLLKKSIQDLQKLLGEQRVQLREMRFKTANDQLKNVHEIKKTRKMIAQILMLLGRKEKGEVVTAAIETPPKTVNQPTK